MAFKTILLLILNGILLFSSNRDSLLLKLNSGQNLSKKEIIELHFKIGSSFNSDKNYSEALRYLRSGLALSSDDIENARFYHKIGQVFVDSTNYKMAFESLNKALAIYTDKDSLRKISNIHSFIGMCYGLTNNLDSALISFQSALTYNIELNDSGAVAQSYFNIGLANYFQGKYDKATENYVKSLRIREELSDTNGLVTSLTTLGETQRVREKYDDAMNYYQNALSFKKGINNKSTLAYIYSEIGVVYKNLKQYKFAQSYLDTALQYSKEIKYKRGIATLYTYMAGIEKELGNTNNALDLYLKSIVQYKNIGFENGVAQSQIKIADIYVARGNYSGAAKLLNSAQEKAKSNNLLEEQTDVARLRYEISKAQKSPLALKHFEKYVELKDSLFNLDKEKQIIEIETKYETEKKEKQIDFLDQETKLQQQQLANQKYLIGGVALAAFFIAALAFFYIRQNKLKSEIKVEQGRFRLLRSQMNPHFIYNALAAIQSVVLKNNPMESASYISGFSKLMRQVLEHSRQDFVSLEEETEFLENYLKLQQLRFNNKFEYKINFDPALLEEKINIPPMLTQPVVENAVEHGVRGLEDNSGRINVDYKYSDFNLLISVTDNGAGIYSGKTGSPKDHKSLATKITRERIQNIKKLQNLDINIQIDELYPDEKNKGTKITFTIPQAKR